MSTHLTDAGARMLEDIFEPAQLESRAAFEKYCDDAVAAKARVLWGYWMNLDPKDTSLTQHLMREGYWESWVSLAVARLVGPGMYCADIGANVGYYSLLMAGQRVNRILAAEPNPRTNALLRATVADNGLQGTVFTVGCAVGDKPGKATLKRYGDQHGSDSLKDSPGYEVTETWEVDMMPLDVLVATWERLDFVKIDVEGAEPEVWAGMKFIRKRFPRLIVLMEVHPWAGYDWEWFLEELSSEKAMSVVQDDGSHRLMSLATVRDLVLSRNGAHLWLA